MTRHAALVPACVALAALSLLLPWALAFDPQVWILWGDGASHLALDTEGGPTWKPLAVAVTTLLAPFGDAAEPLWLVVARTGGLLALAGAYVLGERLAGRVAGVVAALAMALSPWWLLNTALGNSEGLLAASVLWAVVAHLAGRPRAVLALATCAGLLRPEVWPFIGLYVVWLRRPEGLLALAAIGIGWLLPDALGQDGLFAASDIARKTASPGSAQLEAVPGLAVLWDAVEQLGVAVLLAAVAAVVPWRPRCADGARDGAGRARLRGDRRRLGAGRLRRQPALPRAGRGARVRARRGRRRPARALTRCRRRRSWPSRSRSRRPAT